MRKGLQIAVLAATAALGLRAYGRPAAPKIVPTREVAPAWSAEARGRVVYERYGCRMCHGDDGKGGVANTNAQGGTMPAVIYVGEGYTLPELRKLFLTGVARIERDDPKGPVPPYRMPGWGGQMSDQEADDLARYLMSLLPKSAEEKWR